MKAVSGKPLPTPSAGTPDRSNHELLSTRTPLPMEAGLNFLKSVSGLGNFLNPRQAGYAEAGR